MSFTNVTLPGGSGVPAIDAILYMLNDASPGVYVPIGNQADIDWGLKNEFADTTNQGVNWRQRIFTLHDADQIKVKAYFIPDSGNSTQEGGIEGHGFEDGLGSIAIGDNLPRYWKWVFPDGATVFFAGFLADMPISAKIGNAMELNFTVQLTGEVFLDDPNA